MDTLTMNLQALGASSISSHFGYMSKQAIYDYGYPLLIHGPIANFLYIYYNIQVFSSCICFDRES